MRVALAEKAVDVNVVLNGGARTGKAAVEGDDRVEQAIHGAAARHEVDAQEGREEQVSLPRLNGDAGRKAPSVEVPGTGTNVVFRHHTAGG